MIGNGRECSNDTDLDGYPDTRLTIGCNDKPVKSCPVVRLCFHKAIWLENWIFGTHMSIIPMTEANYNGAHECLTNNNSVFILFI